jgi:hypothetical protein
MLAPVVAAGVLLLIHRRRLVAATPLRALWLVPLVLLATVLASRIQAGTVVSDSLVNRVLAVVVLAAAIAFVRMNWNQQSRLVRSGVLLTAAGAAGNALASLVYGFMPVLAASARWLGSDLQPGDRPDPQYVAAHASQLPALLLGDVLPVPGLDAVISIGDLLLAPGCAILLAAVLAPLFEALPVSHVSKEVNP